ncbi:MAG: hypothetical protein KGS72_06595 [Cyanobacteria bacterium REEB67]|nr:hypothetical protein [Cyanobacteria bacterium REEB67]
MPHAFPIACAFLLLAVAQIAAPAHAQGASAIRGASQEGAVVRTANHSEEGLLAMALKELKASNLNEAINNLAMLKDEYPDNDDYGLLYRTALRKRNSTDGDSQKWYAYERALEKKNSAGGESAGQLDEPKRAQVLTVPSSGRINQLKKATWVVLTTGKHRSANQGRGTDQER